jgi:DegV family protein with EDD domain
MNIAVVVDSSSAITPKLAEEFHLQLAPLHLMWDKNEYADWVDMNSDEFYTRLKTAETLPTTSGSVQGEFLDLFERLKGKADGIVAITLSPDTPSAGYRSALMAKELVEGIPVEVVDGNFAASALGLVATAAAKVAFQGGSLEEVIEAAQRVIPKMNTFWNPGSIGYFIRGGRVAESDIESREDSHIISQKDGKIVPIEKYSTRAEARNRLRELLKEKAKKETPLHVGLFHAMAKNEADEFASEIVSQYNCVELWIGEASPVLAIHMSPESIGLAFYNE